MILFLDFDGVLHPEYEAQAVPADIAFCHLPRFEAVMRDYSQVEIVISSTWREQFPLAALQARFSPDIAARIIGTTPIITRMDGKYVPARREGEILGWLAAAGRAQDGPWLALDDAAWQFKLHRSRLIACVRHIGFDDTSEAALRKELSSHSN